jgi:hypothetical protein
MHRLREPCRRLPYLEKDFSFCFPLMYVQFTPCAVLRSALPCLVYNTHNITTSPAVHLNKCRDEPTSGLDSEMALNVMDTLLSLARRNRTVVCTIHQPNSDITSLFDDLMLLAAVSEAAWQLFDEAQTCHVLYLVLYMSVVQRGRAASVGSPTSMAVAVHATMLACIPLACMLWLQCSNAFCRSSPPANLAAMLPGL